MDMIYRMARRGPITQGILVERPNRFVVTALVQGREARCYLPNPGRLWELLYPGVELLLDLSGGEATEYTVLGVRKGGAVVPLHTHQANDLAAKILRRGAIPGLEHARVKRREITAGESRFDLLLQEEGREIYAEVKCCTLFAGKGAYFPDAPSERASRHVRHLSDMAKQGIRTAVIVLVNSTEPQWFLPDWHTDPVFASELLKSRGQVDLIPLSVKWNDDLEVFGPVRRLSVPWKMLEQENLDQGLCLVLIEADGEIWGVLENCENRLSSIASAWGRGRKRPRNRGEELRSRGRLIAAIPFRSSETILTDLKEDLEKLTERPFEHDSGLWIGKFKRDPRRWPPFVEILLHYRFTRLDTVAEREIRGSFQNPAEQAQQGWTEAGRAH